MNVMKFFTIIIRFFPGMFILNVLVLCLLGGVETLSILSISPIIDSFSDSTLVNSSELTQKFIHYAEIFNLEANLKLFVIFFLLVIFLKALLNLFFKLVSLKTKYVFLEKFLVGSFSSFFKSGLPFFQDSQQGVLLNTFNSEILTVGNSISSMSLLFSNSIRFLFFVVVPFTISWQLSLVTIVVFGIVSIPSVLTDKISYKMGQKNVQTANQIQIVLQESLSSVKVILGFGNAEKTIKNYQDRFLSHKKVTIPFQMISFTLSSIYEPILILVLVSVLWLALGQFKIKLSEILVILYAFKSMIPLILAFMSEKNNIAGFIPSYEQVQKLERKAAELQIADGTKNFSGSHKGIHFKNVQFSYLANKPVLNQITLDFPKNKMIALVGKSGSGKTTIVDLMMGFYHPDYGEISIDGVNLKDYKINSYREKIGYVPQESVLFNQTIRENLLWAKDNATEQEIKEALRLAHALPFIEKLPQGLDTLVGDRGATLSGGERQRVAFARAILRKPDLLILDEATSALDSESEKAIQAAIKDVAHTCTIVVIAHRLSTIKEADLIYVINQGQLSESGSYDTLLASQGIFSQLVQNQHS